MYVRSSSGSTYVITMVMKDIDIRVDFLESMSYVRSRCIRASAWIFPIQQYDCNQQIRPAHQAQANYPSLVLRTAVLFLYYDSMTDSISVAHGHLGPFYCYSCGD